MHEGCTKCRCKCRVSHINLKLRQSWHPKRINKRASILQTLHGILRLQRHRNSCNPIFQMLFLTMRLTLLCLQQRRHRCKLNLQMLFPAMALGILCFRLDPQRCKPSPRISLLETPTKMAPLQQDRYRCKTVLQMALWATNLR